MSAKPTSLSRSTPASGPSSLFSSTLTSLLSEPSSAKTTGRARTSNPNTKDIFTTHNRGSKKRALADISSDSSALSQKHATNIEGIDASDWHRSKRKMEEKARLYASMKRGDYVPAPGRDNREEAGLVDFDRMFAEKPTGERDSSDGEDDGGGDSEEEMVEYEDELGRTRRGTKAEAERELRRRNAKVYASEQLANFSARPERPQNIIVGDTIQAAAFNPDAVHTSQMEELAKKRDRSATPPEEVHYDASKEVRSKGVGFYAFSQDKEGRKREMEGLGREREETERRKREREERKEAKKRVLEDRKREIGKRREEKLAERFLREFDAGGAG